MVSTLRVVRHGRAVVMQLLVVVRADVAPRNTSSRCEERRVHRHHVSKCPWMGQSFTIRICHRARSRALISPTLSFLKIYRNLAVENLLADFRDAGTGESVSRGQPSLGFSPSS
jgi:hypothetical protein